MGSDTTVGQGPPPWSPCNGRMRRTECQHPEAQKTDLGRDTVSPPVPLLSLQQLRRKGHCTCFPFGWVKRRSDHKSQGQPEGGMGHGTESWGKGGRTDKSCKQEVITRTRNHCADRTERTLLGKTDAANLDQNGNGAGIST